MESPPLDLSTPNKKIDWSVQFLKFISEAEVPQKGYGNGSTYDLNKYSEIGMKAFKKALEGGVQYAIFVKSTLLYYKTHKTFPLKIGNYIADGAWRSDYEALLSSATDGTVEQHIQKEINDGTEFNQFELG